MKQSKECPKCGGLAIGMFPRSGVSVVEKDGSVSLGGSFAAEIVTCADCGYYETYMRTPLSQWKKPVEKSEYEFVWLRPPPGAQGPFR